VEVTAIGHQFWWEFRYPKLGIVTANELHVPVSDGRLSHTDILEIAFRRHGSQLLGTSACRKDRLDPNHPNGTWIDPMRRAYFSVNAHSSRDTAPKMLLRVYVDTQKTSTPGYAGNKSQRSRMKRSRGKQRFETTACLNCHVDYRTNGTGRFGPDLTHLMSRRHDRVGRGGEQRTNLSGFGFKTRMP